MELRIEFTKGVGDLQFGQSISQVTELIGEPTETEQIGEDMEMPTTVLHYTETGLSLFFENTSKETLVCIDIHSQEATLFGQKTADKTPQEITRLLKDNNITDIEHDKEAPNEERISSEQNSADFYFYDNKLESITIGR